MTTKENFPPNAMTTITLPDPAGLSIADCWFGVFGTRDRLRLRGWILALVLITIGIISRKPDLVFNPQFFGDEGTWYKQAYDYGAFHTLFHNQAGYMCVGSKLPTLIAAYTSLTQGPRIYQTYTVLLEVLCVSFLLTSRLSGMAGLRSRVLLAFLWIAVPNADEINTLNCTQWPLAVLGALFLFSDKPLNLLWKIVDVAAITIIALTGPFCIFLLPIGGALLIARQLRNKWTLVLTTILGLGCLAQGWTLSHHLGQCRPQTIQGPFALQVVAAQMFLFGAARDSWTALVAPLGSHTGIIGSSLVVTCGIALALYALFKGPLPLRLFTLYGGLVLLACGNRLHCSAGQSWALLLLNPVYAARYWYIERLSLLALFVWMLSASRPAVIRMIGSLVILLVLIVSIRNWQYPASPDLHFTQYATVFDKAPRGTLMNIPINPGWTLIMVKH